MCPARPAKPERRFNWFDLASSVLQSLSPDLWHLLAVLIKHFCEDHYITTITTVIMSHLTSHVLLLFWMKTIPWVHFHAELIWVKLSQIETRVCFLQTEPAMLGGVFPLQIFCTYYWHLTLTPWTARQFVFETFLQNWNNLLSSEV